MQPSEDDQVSTASDDLEDISTLKNLLEVQSRLKAKTDSIENDAG